MYELLRTRCEETPWIADLCGGSGSDIICMLMGLGARRIDYVESGTWEGTNAFEHGMQNIHNFVQEFEELKERVDLVTIRQYVKGGPLRIVENTTPGRTLIVPCHMETSEYFRRLPTQSHLNMVYVDPPFAIDDSGFEATNSEMVGWFVDNVMVPMGENRITSDYFCVKSRAPPQHFKEIFEKRYPEVTYVAAEACAPFRFNVNEKDVASGLQTKGVFYWIFFAANSMRAGVYTNNMLWNDLVNEGNDVLVDRKNCISPVFPSYSGNGKALPDKARGDEGGGDLVRVSRNKIVHRQGHSQERKPMDPNVYRSQMNGRQQK